MMTTPVTDTDNPQRAPWNLLTTSLESLPTFVLIDRLFLYLVQTNDAPLNYIVGQAAWIPVLGRSSERYTLFSPRGDLTELSSADGQISMPFTDLPGIYRLRSRTEDTMAKGFAVNLMSNATRLERVSREDLARYLGEDRVRIATNEDQIVREIDQVRIGREFYPFLMPVLAFVLALEYIVSNRFYSRSL